MGTGIVLARRSGTIGDLEHPRPPGGDGRRPRDDARARGPRDRAALAGDVLAEALGGQLGDDDLRGRLLPFGIDGDVAVLLFELDDSADDAVLLAESLAVSIGGGRNAAGRPLLCAIVDPGERDPVELAREGREALAASGRKVRAAASRATPVASLRRAFHEARCALEATAMANGHAPDVASHRDLGAFAAALAAGRRGPAHLRRQPARPDLGRRGVRPELLRSLEAFIERNGQWERAPATSTATGACATGSAGSRS